MNSSPNILFSFVAPRKQYFSFPPDVISRLWKNSFSQKTFYKLNQTCKYFFSKRKIILLPKCYIGKKAEERFGKEFSIKYDKNDLIWLNKSLTITGRLSNELSKIYHCTLEYLGICEATLTISEFDFLVSDKSITAFSIMNASIKNENGTIVPIDFILHKIPNIKYFDYKNNRERYHVSTLQRMVLLNLLNKIFYLSLDLSFVSKSFDSNYLCFFIQKFAASSAEINFHVSSKDYYHLQYITQTLKRNMDSMIQRWDNTSKPAIKINWKHLKY